MSTPSRLLRALAREGLTVSVEDSLYRVRLTDHPDAPVAEVLLPAELPVESRAFVQLAQLAATRHPAGGVVRAAAATPDFHPGDGGVAIGSVVHTEGMLIPAAVGTDINCGMRLHVVDLSVDRFLKERERFVTAMKGDLFFGTRDVVLDASASRAMFEQGVPGWLAAVRKQPLGCMARSDLPQLERELTRIHLGGALPGHARWAPGELVPATGRVRDQGLGTVGGGNHFVELQVVEEVLSPAEAFAWGVRRGQLAVMVHSGSRDVGRAVGTAWAQRARDAWPRGSSHPGGGLLPLSLASHPELVQGYLQAEATAANYGFVNRLLLAELVRLRLREIHGALEVPLVYDLPHNITLPQAGGWVARKGACPAAEGQPVIIPGSMGSDSFLLVGHGQPRLLSSASHGAGRARSRFDMGRAGSNRSESALGLTGVDCVTLREERRIEEAPAAYKPIRPVIDAQVREGLVTPVARLRPLLTFKA